MYPELGEVHAMYDPQRTRNLNALALKAMCLCFGTGIMAR
jgi:hypothetical protein